MKCKITRVGKLKCPIFINSTKKIKNKKAIYIIRGGKICPNPLIHPNPLKFCSLANPITTQRA